MDINKSKMTYQLKRGMLLHRDVYRIEQVLGQGSFGITYLAVHIALNKKVAIKEFFMKELNGRSEDGSITGMSDGSLSMNYARKFQKEALNLSRLDHPNIVRVTDSFEDNGTFYYVMDYIEGENLNDYVKHTNIPSNDAVKIIREVAKALQYMHEEKHMLHFDIKPGNVMRRSIDGHIFIIDFGLSKHYSSNGQPETSTTIGLGTPGYAPIEQANQTKNGEFRPTIDVYALGATFYKLLTRETPPDATELVSNEDLIAEKLQKHHIVSQLSTIVIQAMCPSVKRRTQTVRDFLASLPKWVTNTPNSSNDAITSRSNNEQTIVKYQPTREETIIAIKDSLKKSSVDKENFEQINQERQLNEGLWHEFVRLADGEVTVYSSRIGKTFAFIIFPWLIIVIPFFVVGYSSDGELFEIFLEFGGLSIILFVILYLIARIWHILKYDIFRGMFKK